MRGGRRGRVGGRGRGAVANARNASAWRSRSGVDLAPLGELVQRVLADRLEHREPDVAVEVVADPDEALLGEALEAADRRRATPRRRGCRTRTRRSRAARRPRTRPGARTAAAPRGRAGRGSSRSRPAASAGAPGGRARPRPAGPAGRPGAAPSRRATAAGSGRRPARSPAAARPAGARSPPRGRRSRRSARSRAGRPSRARRTAAPPPTAMSASGSVTSGGGSDSGGTGNSCSPEIRSGARLDTITVSLGADRSRSATTGAPGDDLLEVVEDEQRRAGPGGGP